MAETREEVMRLMEKGKVREDACRIISLMYERMDVYRGRLQQRLLERVNELVESGMVKSGKNTDRRLLGFYSNKFSNFRDNLVMKREISVVGLATS